MRARQPAAGFRRTSANVGLDRRSMIFLRRSISQLGILIMKLAVFHESMSIARPPENQKHGVS